MNREPVRTLLLLLAVFLVGCGPKTVETDTGPTNVADWLPDEYQREIHFRPITESFEAKVVGITDGDTIKVLTSDRKEIKIRLEGIDCPETKQPFGNNAKQKMSELVFGKMVTIHKTELDRYGRTLAFVEVDGVNTSEEMIRSGLAWWYQEYSDSVDLAQMQDQAKAAKRGLWAAIEAPISPWEWRKMN